MYSIHFWVDSLFLIFLIFFIKYLKRSSQCMRSNGQKHGELAPPPKIHAKTEITPPLCQPPPAVRRLPPLGPLPPPPPPPPPTLAVVINRIFVYVVVRLLGSSRPAIRHPPPLLSPLRHPLTAHNRTPLSLQRTSCHSNSRERRRCRRRRCRWRRRRCRRRSQRPMVYGLLCFAIPSLLSAPPGLWGRGVLCTEESGRLGGAFCVAGGGSVGVAAAATASARVAVGGGAPASLSHALALRCLLLSGALSAPARHSSRRSWHPSFRSRVLRAAPERMQRFFPCCYSSTSFGGLKFLVRLPAAHLLGLIAHPLLGPPSFSLRELCRQRPHQPGLQKR